MEYLHIKYQEGQTSMMLENNWKKLYVFGNHNLMNIQAAWLVCRELGIAVKHFSGTDSPFYRCFKKTRTAGFQ